MSYKMDLLLILKQSKMEHGSQLTIHTGFEKNINDAEV